MAGIPDPFGDETELPEGLAEFLKQLGGPGVVRHLRLAFSTLSAQRGPVNWELAGQVARPLAAEADRPPTPAEVARAEEAWRLAEHWLDQGGLPAPPDAGHLEVATRQAWVDAALVGMRPLVEPVAAAAVRALGDLLADEAAVGFDFPGGVSALRAVIEPMGGVLMGLQSGQVIGQLARQLLGQFDLAIPTAVPETAYHLAVNVEEAFAGYGLDPMEVAVVLALHESAHRRQYHAVAWLAGHVRELVAAFAAGTKVDSQQLMNLSQELLAEVDPDDPESVRAAVERAGQVRLEPTPEQLRVLQRLQGVVCLLQAWARHEVRAAARLHLPNLERVGEVLRRRRASRGTGERLLAGLLGLDLKPDDERVGDRFVAVVHEARGLDGLRRALAHPENLPDAAELSEPSRWLARMAGGEEIPDDASSLFGTGDAPVEPPADERGTG